MTSRNWDCYCRTQALSDFTSESYYQIPYKRTVNPLLLLSIATTLNCSTVYINYKY